MHSGGTRLQDERTGKLASVEGNEVVRGSQRDGGGRREDGERGVGLSRAMETEQAERREGGEKVGEEGQ